MASWEALREAEAVLGEANGLMSEIDSEVAAMAAACTLAQECHERVKRLAVEAVEHAAELGEALRAGRQLEAAILEQLAQLDGCSPEPAVLQARLTTPALAAIEHRQRSAWTVPRPVLPRFRKLTRQDLEQAELAPLATNGAAWAALAEECRTFQEQYEAALELIEATDKAAGPMAVKRRPPRPSRREVADGRQTRKTSEG